MAVKTEADAGFALYIHWPFCAAKCPYCDFNSHVRPAIDHARFGKALLDELHWSAEHFDKRPLGSIFFGGGTPSLMPPALVGELIETAQKLYGFEPNIEITLEANPTSVDAERFKGYASAGVNRASLGVQSLNDADLARLGRLHSADEALKAIELARNSFPRLSFDLIYARPEQSLENWRRELRRALSFANDHLSLYQLTIEPDTAYARLFAAGKLQLPPEEQAEAMYEATSEICAAYGLLAYEVSNYAKLGAESRHNLTYWRYGDYVGIGAGAHGRVRQNGVKLATADIKMPEKWAQSVEQHGHGHEECEVLPLADQAREMALMGLRLHEGISRARLLKLSAEALNETVVSGLVKDGFLSLEADIIKATPKGRLVLNHLLGEILN